MAAVKAALLQTDGVTDAVVDLKGHRATVQYEGQVTDPRAIMAAVTEARP